MKGVTKEELKALVDVLGPTIIAIASGTRNHADVQLWVDGQEFLTVNESMRLTLFKELFDSVSAATDAHRARAWFLGQNCLNMTISPMIAIRLNMFDEVRASALRMINDM